MLNKPLNFILFNFFSFLVVLYLGGFKMAFPLSILISIIIIGIKYKKYGFKGGLVFATIYLLTFDSEVFCFTDYNIRVWYAYLILIYFISVYEFIKSPNIVLNRNFIVEYIVGFLFFIWSIYFLIIEDFTSIINNIKYWVFFIGLILVLNKFFRRNLNNYKDIINYLISITIFITFWGILQFFTNLFFLPYYQLDYFNVRPSAFFSETTWYSEFIFFGFLFVLLKVLTEPNMLKLLYLFPFYLLGFLFSVTRNTFLALFLYLFLTFTVTFFLENKIYSRIIKSKFIIGSIVLLCFMAIIYLPEINNLLSVFVPKFSGDDVSAQGRIEAYHLSIESIKNGNLMGGGYYWDKSQTTDTGSALGSKSFNIFLMIGSIFGIFGGILFMLFIFYIIIKKLHYYNFTKSIFIKYSFILFLVFIQMAMFAPIHQFPFGMLIVSLSVFLFNLGLYNYEKNNICNAPI